MSRSCNCGRRNQIDLDCRCPKNDRGLYCKQCFIDDVECGRILSCALCIEYNVCNDGDRDDYILDCCGMLFCYYCKDKLLLCKKCGIKYCEECIKYHKSQNDQNLCHFCFLNIDDDERYLNQRPNDILDRMDMDLYSDAEYVSDSSDSDNSDDDSNDDSDSDYDFSD